MQRNESLVRITFELEPDEDGYPPVGSETLWAIDLGNDTYRVRNAPLFVDGVSVADVVEAHERRGTLTFAQVVHRGGHSTVRIFIRDKDRLPSGVPDELTRLGANLEHAADHNLIAVDIPAEVSLRAVCEALEPHRQTDSLDYWAGVIAPGHDAEDLPI
jgi:hypothetical protein